MEKVTGQTAMRFSLTVTDSSSTLKLRSQPILYVFKEGSPESGDTNFRMVFPNAATNNGSAALGPDQTIQSEWMTFPATAGTENFWLVWSLTPVPQLETAKTEAFTHPRGGLNDPTLTVVNEFLRTQRHVSIWHYKESQRASPRGQGDILVALAQFKHTD